MLETKGKWPARFRALFYGRFCLLPRGAAEVRSGFPAILTRKVDSKALLTGDMVAFLATGFCFFFFEF